MKIKTFSFVLQITDNQLISRNISPSAKRESLESDTKQTTAFSLAEPEHKFENIDTITLFLKTFGGKPFHSFDDRTVSVKLFIPKPVVEMYMICKFMFVASYVRKLLP